MRKSAGIVASFLFIFALTGCANLSKSARQQNRDWDKLSKIIRKDELVLITIENKDRDLVPLCGSFIVIFKNTIYIHHSITENFDKAKRPNQQWYAYDDQGTLVGFDQKEIKSLEYCLHNTPDRRPLYQNYGP